MSATRLPARRARARARAELPIASHDHGSIILRLDDDAAHAVLAACEYYADDPGAALAHDAAIVAFALRAMIDRARLGKAVAP